VAERCPYKAALLSKYLENHRAGERMTVPVSNTFQRTKPSHPDDEHFTGKCPTCQQPDLCARVRELEDALEKARAEARSEERERCLDIAENFYFDHGSEGMTCDEAADMIAKRIREQKP